MRLSNKQSNLVIFFFILFSILIISLAWDNIVLPFNNNLDTKGELSLIGYNPLNDTLRYILFISFPLVVFLILKYFLKKKFIRVNELFFEKSVKVNENGLIINLIAFAFMIIVIFEFLSLNLPTYRLDSLHDGLFLTPAQNYLSTSKLWISSYSVHGISDIFYPILMWKIFDVQSIGSARMFIIFLAFLVKISCILLSYQFTKIVKFNLNQKILFFIIFTSILISMSNYNYADNGYFNGRDLYVILFLILFIQLFLNSNLRSLITIFITIIASFAILFQNDTGVYLNILLFSYIIYLLIIKKYNEVLIIFLSLISFWSIIILIVGVNEIKFFLYHLISIVQSMDLLHGTKHPIPFFSIGEIDTGPRATRGLFLQLTGGLLVLNYLVSTKENIFSSKKFFLVFLFFLSLLMYKNALGRSDADHLRMSQDLPILINCFFLITYLLTFIEKKIKLFNYSSKKIFNFLSVSFFIFLNLTIFTSYDLDKIRDFRKNLTYYVNLDDENFIDKKNIKFLSHFNEITLDEKCIQIFTYDSAVPYLLKKPSCTKYYSSWLASPINKQKDYIDRLKKSSPEFILYKSPGTNFDLTYNIVPSVIDRLEHVNSYIKSNYELHSEVNGYVFMKKK